MIEQTPDPPRTVLDPETGIEEPVTTGRIPDAEFVEPPLMPPAAADREAPDPLSLSDLRKVVPAPPVDPDGGKR